MTEQSSHAKFNEAMAKFQGDYEPPKKDKKVDYTTKQGQRIKYDYSDLESLQKAIRTTASKYGLSWNVDFEYKDTEITNYGKTQKALMIIANVIINHSSGAEKTFKGIPLYATSFDPQSIGSVKTYSERYALSGAFGIASGEDDDGQIAKDRQSNNQNSDNQQTNRPPQDDNAQKIEQAIQEYQDFLLDHGRNLGELNQYIVKQEKVQNISQVDRLRVMGYYKAFVKKQETDNLKADRERQQQTQNRQQQSQEPQQQSFMEGNTTNIIDWGKK
ncbi:hypothetical protein CHCC20442_4335 [Bacillus licheniformis]|uniref:ERF family protein n=1 Tax=Bacillus licheniformis TaxID=1402 RepID=UPI0013237309|nr:ERF family protein [Bacillus licheniformis]TWK08622.1 hypothetical protein CHCC20442_4335 [Bacillus licheniformis]